jgi:murein DD-endopeptidase MepM/ murein hydrolase activator NlpD
MGALGAVALDPVSDDAALLWQRALVNLTKRAAFLDEALAPALLGGPTPGEEVAPAPLPVIESAPAFVLSEEGPLGCPVKPSAGRVVMTQGYGVGTHAPAATWGAVDLAVDGDGDGYAEAGSSWYTPIVATHDGHVTVTLDSYPGGNHIWLNEPGGVWRTGYAHLAMVTVVTGQFVRAGEQIGLLGSSGMSSGPHLDYQVWRSGVNVDPTYLVGCA